MIDVFDFGIEVDIHQLSKQQQRQQKSKTAHLFFLDFLLQSSKESLIPVTYW